MQPREHRQSNPDPGAAIRGITLLVSVPLLVGGIICLVAGWNLETYQNYCSGKSTIVITNAAARWFNVAWLALGCGGAMILQLLPFAAWKTSRWRCRLARESLIDPLARPVPTSFLYVGRDSLSGWATCVIMFSLQGSSLIFGEALWDSALLSRSRVYLAILGIAWVISNGLWLVILQEQENDVAEILQQLKVRARGARGDLAERKASQIKNILDGMQPIPQKMQPIPQKAYSIGQYPVTQSQWEAIMGENPSVFDGDDDHPVEHVSWDDCQQFLNRLNETAEAKKARLTFRLPTEEEWNHACEAGARGLYCRLADGTEITADTLDQVAWFKGNSDKITHSVGQKQPNAFGLYDMLGNVSEWTSTEVGWFGGDRVTCGGSWKDSARNCEPSYLRRRRYSRFSRYGYLGFRLCASGRAD